MSDLESRLRRVEDQLALRELVARYGVAIDDHNFAALLPLFTKDCRYGRAGNPAALMQGGANIVANLEARLKDAPPSYHVMHDQILDFDPEDPNRASGIVTCHAETAFQGHGVTAIRYLDSYLRQDGRWKIDQRQISFLYYVPLDQYPGILTSPNRMRDQAEPGRADWPSYG